MLFRSQAHQLAVLLELDIGCLGVIEVERQVGRIEPDTGHMHMLVVVVTEHADFPSHTRRQGLDFRVGELDIVKPHQRAQRFNALGYRANGKHADAVKLGNAQVAINVLAQMIKQLLFRFEHGGLKEVG